MAADYYYFTNEQRIGPVSPQQLKDLAAKGEILPDTLVWKEGMAKPQPASKLKGLMEPSAKPSVISEPTRGAQTKTVPATSPRQRHIPITFYKYLTGHFASARGLWVWWAILAILLAPVLSFAKPFVGFRGLVIFVVGTGVASALAGILYLIQRVLAFYLGGERNLPTNARSRMAQMSYGCFAMLTPLAVLLGVEFFSPPRGIIATLLPDLRNAQERIPGNVLAQLDSSVSASAAATNPQTVQESNGPAVTTTRSADNQSNSPPTSPSDSPHPASTKASASSTPDADAPSEQKPHTSASANAAATNPQTVQESNGPTVTTTGSPNNRSDLPPESQSDLPQTNSKKGSPSLAPDADAPSEQGPKTSPKAQSSLAQEQLAPKAATDVAKFDAGSSPDDKPVSDSSAQVLAEGVGATSDEALKDAYRNAVRQVVGAVVDAETLLKNDEIIDDKVLTYSGGFIKTYVEVPGSKKVAGGLHRIKIKASVERRGVIAKLKAANVSLKQVDGKDLFAEVVTQLDAEKDAASILKKQFEGFPQSCITASIIDKPENAGQDAATATVKLTVKIEPDLIAYKAFTRQVIPLLEKIAKDKGEFTSTFKPLIFRNDNTGILRLSTRALSGECHRGR